MARLGDICDVRDGTHDSPLYVVEGYPLVTSKNIVNGKLDMADISYISFEDYNKINERSKVNTGDIIMPMIGTIGNPYIVEEFTDFAIKNVALIKFTNDMVYNKYIFHFLNSDKFKEYIKENNRGGTQKFLSLKDIRNIQISLPSLVKQMDIVERLDKISNMIYLRKQQLTKLDELVKSRFIEMFGDPVKNTMRWPSKPLNDVCDGIGDGLHGTPEYDDNGNYPFINGNNLIDGKIVITSATKTVSEETYAKHRIDISPNAILISINGTLGKLAFYNGDQVMLGKSACYCNLKENINKVFVYGVMKSDAFAEFLDNSSTKSTIKNVGLKAMREYKLILPPSELQEQFASFVEQTDKSKFEIQKSLEKLETLKKALMQKYFG